MRFRRLRLRSSSFHWEAGSFLQTSFDVLEDCSLDELKDIATDPDTQVRLREMDRLFRAYLQRIKDEGMRSQGHLTEANLRLVVSVGKEIHRPRHGPCWT